VRVTGSCVTPLAAHATIEDETLTLRALIAQPDGKRVIRGEEVGGTRDAAGIGQSLGDRLLAEGGAEILHMLEAR
jgi:hydroxymethylbilane synthase